MAESLIDIRPDHLEMVCGILQKHVPEHEVWAFGSRAKWTAKDYSDLDLCIVTDKPLSFKVLSALDEDFAGSELPWKVDVVDWATTSESFRKIIERDKVVVQPLASSAKGMGKMGDGLPMRSLGEVMDNFDSLRRPVKASERQSGSYPYYGAQGIVDYVDGFLFDGEFVLVAEDGENLRSRKEDIALIACGKFWVNNHAHILRGNKEADTRFLFYAINSTDISGYVTGSTIPKLSQGSLNRLLIPCPRIEEQRAIASLLRTLDDKIDLNRHMNETLEAMARLLFKDWFVDFGPTRAKAEGRTPYLTPELWSLFPDALDDDDKPVGWLEVPLLNHAKLISGGTPKTNVAAYWGGQIAWASAKDVSQCADHFLVETDRTITELGVEQSSTRIVPRLATIVVARGATTGRFCILGRDMAMNQTCYALHSIAHRPFWLATAFANVVPFLVNAAHGSVFDTITTTTIERSRVLIGDTQVMDSFEGLIAPLFEQILANVKESRTLAKTRDLLLPKLMSGEIRLREAEKIVEQAL